MISQDTIAHFKTQLENHPIYEAVSSLEDLQIFMQHHVYSVCIECQLRRLPSGPAPRGVPVETQHHLRREAKELL